MCKRIGIGMVRLSLIAVLGALLGTEANAATTCQSTTCVKTTTCNCQIQCLIGGTCKKTCISPKTGSEIFDITIWGVPGPLFTGCATTDEPDEPCLEVQCSVYGTVDIGPGCDATTLDPDCGIQGVAICENPRCHNRKNDPDCEGNFSNGQPYILETPLTQSGFFQPRECTRQGRCRTSIELEPELTDEICINPNWEFQTFTAAEFNGECCTCDFGFDSNGDCCGSRDRNSDGSCVTLGDVSCGTMRCTVDLSQYEGEGHQIPYECGPIPSQP